MTGEPEPPKTDYEQALDREVSILDAIDHVEFVRDEAGDIHSSAETLLEHPEVKLSSREQRDLRTALHAAEEVWMDRDAQVEELEEELEEVRERIDDLYEAEDA